MVFNGAAGSKYGVPFAMILRASYGVRGALLPGLLRGGIAAIMWFGLQCYAGSLAFLILLGKLWPAFLTFGGDFKLLGLSLPGLIAFLVFWLINVGIGFGGGKVLNKFTAILNPCIYIVFGGMAIWAISLVGFGPILDYLPTGVAKAEHTGFLFLVVINAVVAVWAAPAVSASDFTQNARSFREQAIGQTLGLVVAYILLRSPASVLSPGPVSTMVWIPERAGYSAEMGQPVCLVLCGAGDIDDHDFHQRYR